MVGFTSIVVVAALVSAGLRRARLVSTGTAVILCTLGSCVLYDAVWFSSPTSSTPNADRTLHVTTEDDFSLPSESDSTLNFETQYQTESTIDEENIDGSLSAETKNGDETSRSWSFCPTYLFQLGVRCFLLHWLWRVRRALTRVMDNLFTGLLPWTFVVLACLWIVFLQFFLMRPLSATCGSSFNSHNASLGVFTCDSGYNRFETIARAMALESQNKQFPTFSPSAPRLNRIHTATLVKTMFQAWVEAYLTNENAPVRMPLPAKLSPSLGTSLPYNSLAAASRFSVGHQHLNTPQGSILLQR